METAAKSMDRFSTYLGVLPRRFPHPAKVHTVGYMPHKRDWCDLAFPTMNFSFILKGSGHYEIAGRTYEVRSPCVITQWPGVHCKYGPSGEWEELYLIYPPEARAPLEASGLANLAKPVWYIRDPGPTRRKLEELFERVRSPDDVGAGDAIDRVAESLILESYLGEIHQFGDDNEAAVAKVRTLLDETYLEEHDFDELALRHGLSPTTFRRHWARHVGMPPARYCTELRLRRACRMLVETQKSVAQIARALSFADPLHFSRRFRQFTGQTATAYRKRHQSPLSFEE
jgi:AraC-like DNA-binding protein